MASGTLAKVMPEVFAHEGVYGKHPKDPGGATNYGITARTLGNWRKLGRIATDAEVKALSKTEATAIYRAQYWNFIRGDDLPAGVDYAVFDFGINSGVVRAVMEMQKILGTKADGIVGVNTLALAKGTDAAKLVRAICARRQQYLERIRTFPTFGKGWTRRVNDVRKTALSLI